MKKKQFPKITLLIVAAIIALTLLLFFTQRGTPNTVQMEIQNPVIGTGITTDSATATAGELNE